MTGATASVDETMGGLAIEAVDSSSAAVVGCGVWGKNLIPVFAELGVLAVVRDADGAKANAQAESHSVSALELPAILSDSAVTAAVIAAPPRRHHELARAAPLRIVLVGWSDPEKPPAIPERELRAWDAAGSVAWWGEHSDIAEIRAT